MPNVSLFYYVLNGTRSVLMLLERFFVLKVLFFRSHTQIMIFTIYFLFVKIFEVILFSILPPQVSSIVHFFVIRVNMMLINFMSPSKICFSQNVEHDLPLAIPYFVLHHVIAKCEEICHFVSTSICLQTNMSLVKVMREKHKSKWNVSIRFCAWCVFLSYIFR